MELTPSFYIIICVPIPKQPQNSACYWDLLGLQRVPHSRLSNRCKQEALYEYCNTLENTPREMPWAKVPGLLLGLSIKSLLALSRLVLLIPRTLSGGVETRLLASLPDRDLPTMLMKKDLVQVWGNIMIHIAC